MDKLSMLILTFFAVLAMPIASAHVTVHFDPQDSSVPNGYCNTTHVKVMLNITGSDDVLFGNLGFTTDATCVDVTNLVWGPQINTWMSGWHNESTPNPCGDVVGDVGYDWTLFRFNSPQSNTDVELFTITIHCNCSTCGYCTSPLNFGDGAPNVETPCPFSIADSTPAELYPHNTTLENGTVACGVSPSAETFSKPLYEGWNLISLPLDPEDDTASTVLSGVSYDAVYRYNATATSKQFEGIESTDAMNTGTGYFVHVTADCTWEYDGTANTSMSAPLEPGLNMVGWLNCSKGVGDALSSISEDYYYVARWNTSAEKFEVHNPVAPPAFSDFTTMDRGTGYFISAKQECTLSKSC